MKPSILLSLIAASGIGYGITQLSPNPSDESTAPVIPNLRVMLLDMHRRQVELLKVNWGTPVLCTEWSQGYDSKTQSCGRRGKLFRRSFVDQHDPHI